MSQTPSTVVPNNTLVTHADPERQRLAYQFAKDIHGAIWLLLVGLVLEYELMLFFPIFSAEIRNWVVSISSDVTFVVGFFALVTGSVALLAFAPIVHAFGYVRPKKYGMISITHKAWWKKYAKSYMATLLKFVVIVEIFYWLVRTVPDYWWIMLAVFWVADLVVSNYGWKWNWRKSTKASKRVSVATIYLEISSRFAQLLAKANLPAVPLLLKPVSKDSKYVNAWFIGMGSKRRIEVSDTMLATMNTDEIEAILAHELGHYAHDDIKKEIISRAFLGVLAIFAGYHISGGIQLIREFHGVSDVAGLPYLFAIVVLMRFLVSAFDGNRSRNAEQAADRYAIELTGNPDAYKSAMIKLADLNLQKLNPFRGRPASSGTHPTMRDRINAADIAAGRPKSNGYPANEHTSANQRLPRVVRRISLK